MLGRIIVVKGELGFQEGNSRADGVLEEGLETPKGVKGLRPDKTKGGDVVQRTLRAWVLPLGQWLTKQHRTSTRA